MHTLFNFHFLDTISKQLLEKLEGLTVTNLNATALADLATFQRTNNAMQGVYLLHYDNNPAYLGKADDVADRLSEHFKKLRGRQGIDIAKIGYKSILLDKSMGTAANERLLISLYRTNHDSMWNNSGFGSKDPGQNRDNTTPNAFDLAHPIRLDFQISSLSNEETLKSFYRKMKDELPYICRFEFGEREDEALDLTNVDRTPEALIQAVVSSLGVGWKGGILSFGIVIYKTNIVYRFGKTINP